MCISHHSLSQSEGRLGCLQGRRVCSQLHGLSSKSITGPATADWGLGSQERRIREGGQAVAQTQYTPLLGRFRPPLPGQQAKRGQCELGSEQAFGTGANPTSADSSGPGSQGAGSFDKGFSSRHLGPGGEETTHQGGEPQQSVSGSPTGGRRPLPQSSHLPQRSSFTLFLCCECDPSQWNNRIFSFLFFWEWGWGEEGHHLPSLFLHAKNELSYHTTRTVNIR